MIQNYFKTAIRNIFRNKLTAFINIFGLALAMTCAMMIYLFVTDELSYDRYHSNADRVYRTTRSFHNQDGDITLHLSRVAPPFGPLLKNDFGEIEVMARTLQYSLVMAIEENGERKKISRESNVFMTEPDLFKIFDIEVIAGNPADALSRPRTMMISETMAMKYFESLDVIGKHMRGGRGFDFEVAGVYKNFPPQSHWHPEFMIAFNTLEDSTIYGRRGLETNWGNNAFSTYLLLEKGADPASLSTRFPEFIDKHYGSFVINNFNPAPGFVASRTTKIYLQKVTDVHLRSHLDDELEGAGNINTVYMMSIIGLFIILIACFNFINLSTARATRRSKEVGLRKVVGAFRNQLVTQYLSESVLVAFFGLVLAVGFSWFALDWLNNFTHKSIDLNPVNNLPILLGMAGFAFLVGILAGIYPAFVLSAFKPALVLKGQQGTVKGKGGIRRTLVVVQFAISISLIIATAITMQQLNFLNSRELGYDKDHVITLPVYGELNENYDAFYNELLKSTTIRNAGLSSRAPTGRLLDSNGTPFVLKGDSLVNTNVTTPCVRVDYEFFDTYSIPIVAGRNFSKSVPTDDSLAFIVNETAVKEIGWNTMDEGINKDFQYGGVRGKLIGVVKDFHFESLHQEIVPVVFFISTNRYNSLAIRIAGDNLQPGIEHVQKVWKELLPVRPFDYQFMKYRYQGLYEAEQNQGQLFTIFSLLAILIACLGLFGLATYNTLQRVKEIGIRKVLGASVPNILGLLSREIILLIVVSNLIAWPLAWYFMSTWLSTFAYHIDMNVALYVLAAILTLVLAIVTVSVQTIRAARTNPANTLRYE